MPPLTQALLLANVVVFLLESLGGSAIDWFALWPIASGQFMPWQVATYAFIHGGWLHLGLNMFGLWMFGSELERVWGSRRLALFYGASVLAAAATQLVVVSVTHSMEPTIGASGGLFGLLMGFAMVFPHRRIMLLLPPIPLPAWLFVLLYGLLELTLGATGIASGVAHYAHLGGLLGGWMVMRYWRGQPPFGWRIR